MDQLLHLKLLENVETQYEHIVAVFKTRTSKWVLGVYCMLERKKQKTPLDSMI